MKNAGAGIGTAVLLAVLLVAPATAAMRKGKPAPQRRSSVLSTDTQRRIDINRVNMFVTNIGSFAFDLGTGNAGLYFPKGTNKTGVFASGLWIGATVNGQVRTLVAEYSQEYGAGPILPGGQPDDDRKREHIVYKVQRFTGDSRDTAHVNRADAELSADPTLDPIAHHSWSEYVAGAAPYGAPVRTYRLPNTLSPEPGDSVDVVGPDIVGDQMMWSVYNDADPGLHSNNAGNSSPFGIEIQQTTFGFNRTGALGSTLFLRFKIIHKGTQVMNDTYVSLWSDPDLGGFTDDLVGCDPPLSLGYVYNASNNDQQYGTSPPAIGYDFFQGPTVGGVVLPLASFNKYINGTDPSSPEETYNYMQGLGPNGETIENPITGLPTTFFHSGDPVKNTGWLDSDPADRRFMMSAGPFTLSPGDTQTVVAAIVIARGSDRLSSISGLRFFDVSAQDAFDRGFNLKSPPPQPVVSVDTDEGLVRLCWDANSRLNYNEPGYGFEGYNVYQGASVDGPWTLLGTFDEVNNIKVVRDTVFDINTGQIITDYPVAFGGDNGVAFCYETTQDAVRGLSLHEGTEYFFAVTAYSVAQDTTALDAVLENAITPIRIIPQSPASGTDPTTASLSSFTHSLVDTLIPPSTDEIQVNTVNASLVKDQCFRVFYTSIPPTQVIVGTDTSIATAAWNLLNVTTGETLLVNQLNKTGDPDYRVFDGVQIKVVGAHEPTFQNALYQNLVADNRRALDGVNFGLPFFGGGAGAGVDFFGSTLDPAANPDSFTYAQIRFDHTTTQKAYRFFRRERADGAPPGGPGRAYNYAGFHDVPFTVWDNINNVQLDAGFVERAVYSDDGTTLLPTQPATHDSTWGPDADHETHPGGREYLAIFNRPYSATPKAELTQDNIMSGNFPVLYALWAVLRTADDVIDDGDAFDFVWAKPGTPNDIYDFCTSPLVRSNASLAQAGLAGIRVVPNPYLARSSYELNQFNRIMRFINMPEEATVRIYNLSGQLVRTLRKTDVTTSFINWDLLTDRGLPVASGVYVYHVQAPGVGETHGRLVVFMEKERLNNF
jgi:hypothetical protein